MRDLFYRAFERFTAMEGANVRNGVSERNLCHRLGIHLEDERREWGLYDYFVDAEYNRKQHGQLKTILDDQQRVINVTCDLILHSRGRLVSRDNLIAIEMKKSRRPRTEKEKDRARLRALTRSSYDGAWINTGVAPPEHVCGYEFGAFIELHVEACRITVEDFSGGESAERQVFRVPW